MQKKMPLDHGATSVHRGGHQLIALNPKLELRTCTDILFRREFINHSIIIKSSETCPAHIAKCYNA